MIAPAPAPLEQSPLSFPEGIASECSVYDGQTSGERPIRRQRIRLGARGYIRTRRHTLQHQQKGYRTHHNPLTTEDNIAGAIPV